MAWGESSAVFCCSGSLERAMMEFGIHTYAARTHARKQRSLYRLSTAFLAMSLLGMALYISDSIGLTAWRI